MPSYGPVTIDSNKNVTNAMTMEQEHYTGGTGNISCAIWYLEIKAFCLLQDVA